MEEPAEHYNTDTGTKSSIATRVLTSPQRYSTMRSRVPRMREAGVRAPLADYDTDRLGKKFLATAMQDSRRVYAATFSGSNRFGRVISSEAPDVLYDTDVTKNSNANNFVSAVNRSAVRYSNVRSKIRRKGAELITSAPDINYPVDYLNKESLATGVSRSSRKYHIMTTASSRFGIPLRPSTSDDVGPGFYSYPVPTRRQDLPKELSSFRSTSSRFDRRVDPSRSLGSTWHPEKDRENWNRGGFTISTTQIRRPSYLPNAYEKTS